MKSLTRLGRWRIVGLLALAAALAVAIPSAFGAGSAAAKMKPQLQRQSRLVVSPSLLHKATAMSSSGTCSGGSIAPGTYSSLTVTGFCTVDAGVVTVRHNVTVRPNAGLVAAFGGGPQLVVGGDLRVGSNAVLVLGCEPQAFVCFNDPDQQVGTLSSKGTVFGNLKAHGALAVLVHNTTVGHDLLLDDGGGGVNCNPQTALSGSPAYATFEDMSVGHNADIRDWRSCWLGFFRTTVGHSVHFRNNVVADPDGNEVATNVVADDLVCSGDSPAAQVGDSGGAPNIVLDRASGECAALAGP
ncbi:MAG TPA: hypothetical protein VE984_01795 [Gaiellaceae bacterium]|nr:hypothetical protein [Gaiellaceae bacterium]